VPGDTALLVKEKVAIGNVTVPFRNLLIRRFVTGE